MTMIEDIKSAAREYQAARAEWVRLTRMDVPTPEGVGTFCEVWHCDARHLAMTLALAIRRTEGTCSTAAERAASGEPIRIAAGTYGATPDSDADVYKMSNGLYRDPDGRYLTPAETALIRRLEAPDADYWSPGAVVQRWIRERARKVAGRAAEGLTLSYLIGWPERCSDQDRLAAFRAARDVYRTLSEAWNTLGRSHAPDA